MYRVSRKWTRPYSCHSVNKCNIFLFSLKHALKKFSYLRNFRYYLIIKKGTKLIFCCRKIHFLIALPSEFQFNVKNFSWQDFSNKVSVDISTIPFRYTRGLPWTPSEFLKTEIGRYCKCWIVRKVLSREYSSLQQTQE